MKLSNLLKESKRMQELAGIDSGSEDSQDQFWNIASENGLEQAVSALKEAGFSIEDVCGFIESHWDRL